MSNLKGFVCSSCGQFHEGLPMSFGADAPDSTYLGQPGQRDGRVQLTDDWCVLDGNNFFVRGVLEIPITDGSGPFTWGVWVSLSEKNFKRTLELWDVKGRENEPPYFGWLCTSVPGYPQTLNLKTHVHTQPVGHRPKIMLEPTNHPLAVEQRQGISLTRLQQIVEGLLHSQ